MNQLDDAIRQALSAEDAAILDRVGKTPALWDAWFETFRGPFGGLNILGSIFAFVLFGVFVLCAWRFFEAVEARDMVTWGAGAVLSFFAVGMLKLWFWMEMQKNAVIREIKRLELQVARLAGSM